MAKTQPIYTEKCVYTGLLLINDILHPVRILEYINEARRNERLSPIINLLAVNI